MGKRGEKLARVKSLFGDAGVMAVAIAAMATISGAAHAEEKQLLWGDTTCIPPIPPMRLPTAT